MWSDLPLSAREALKRCVTKEELLDTAARLAPDVFSVRFPSSPGDRGSTTETVRAAIFYARLGAEIAKAMDAEGYGRHPSEDAFEYHRRAEPMFRNIFSSVTEHGFRQTLLQEARRRTPELSKEEISARLARVKPADSLSAAEQILRAYLCDPDFPVPKNEADGILRRVRRAAHPVLPDDEREWIVFLRERIETMKPARARVRKMADRIDRTCGITDPNEPHRMFHHELIMLEDPANPYMPLRRLDGLFAVPDELLGLLDRG